MVYQQKHLNGGESRDRSLPFALWTAHYEKLQRWNGFFNMLPAFFRNEPTRESFSEVVFSPTLGFPPFWFSLCDLRFGLSIFALLASVLEDDGSGDFMFGEPASSPFIDSVDPEGTGVSALEDAAGSVRGARAVESTDGASAAT